MLNFLSFSTKNNKKKNREEKRLLPVSCEWMRLMLYQHSIVINLNGTEKKEESTQKKLLPIYSQCILTNEYTALDTATCTNNLGSHIHDIDYLINSHFSSFILLFVLFIFVVVVLPLLSFHIYNINIYWIATLQHDFKSWFFLFCLYVYLVYGGMLA